MKKVVALRGLSAAAALCAASLASASDWGSFDESRINYPGGVFADGTAHATLRGIVTANGGTIAPATSTLTPAYLSTIDVFYTSLLNNDGVDILSGAERAALQAWIANGGTLICTADIFPVMFYDSFVDAYGVTFTSISSSGTGTTVGAHPIVAGVSTFSYTTDSTFPNPGTGQILGLNTAGDNFMMVMEPGTGFNVGGRILIFGDHNMFTESFIGNKDNIQLANNMAAWAKADSGPDPCPWDLNNDGVVGPPDLAALLAGWGNPYGPADLAALLAAWGPCDVCGPGAGPCEVPNGTPGCEDVECCEAVCANDPFCCEVEWDSICADSATVICAPVPTCCLPGDIPEGEPCGDDNNGGCNSTPEAFFNAQCNASYCGNAWADQGTRDTDWYLINVSTQTLITGILESDFNGVVFIVDGIDTCAPVVIGETGSSSGACSADAAAEACVEPGQYVVFVAPAAFEGTPCGTNNNYRLTIECAPCGPPPNPCNPNAGPCEAPNGTPGCDDPVCCELICSQDSFCCDVEWDQVCADAAIEQCGPCNPNAGPCEAPNGTPGCDDPECCELICSQDPFCCDVEWDQICANAAIEQCGAAACAPKAGNCYLANGTPGCEIIACCETVCADDPFCCDTEWDNLCVGGAVDFCGDAACASNAGDCEVPNGTPGCDDLACCNLVCDNDPFCCDTEWDSICADAAIANCP